MEEIWKTIIINGSDTIYEISSTGKVRNKHTNHELAQNINNRGLMVCNLSVDNKKSTPCIHKLIAEYFVPNPNKSDKAYHINGDPLINIASNIGWTTQSDVVAKGHATKKRGKKIIQYSNAEKKKEDEITTFNSVLDAAENMTIVSGDGKTRVKVNRSTISSVLTGKRTVKNLFLSYAD
jgi:hypothetical protein